MATNGVSSAREQVASHLTAAATRTRALISDHKLQGSDQRKANMFFYALMAVRNELDEQLGVIAPGLVGKIEDLERQCSGRLGAFRRNLQDALTVAREGAKGRG